VKLLKMNEEHFHYELTSLDARVDNFLGDRTRMLYGQMISVMYSIWSFFG